MINVHFIIGTVKTRSSVILTLNVKRCKKSLSTCDKFLTLKNSLESYLGLYHSERILYYYKNEYEIKNNVN